MDKYVTDWSRDGRFLAISQVDSKAATLFDIVVLPLFGDRKPYAFLQTAASEGKASQKLNVIVISPCCQVGDGAPPVVQQSFQDALTRNKISVQLPLPSPAARVGSVGAVGTISDGGGICYIEGPHVHIYAANKLEYRVHDDDNIFVGDPVAHGWDGPKYTYKGPHPMRIEGDPNEEYCYIEGPHYHAWAPAEGPDFQVVGGAYFYVGTPPQPGKVCREGLINVYRAYNNRFAAFGLCEHTLQPNADASFTDFMTESQRLAI